MNTEKFPEENRDIKKLLLKENENIKKHLIYLQIQKK